MKNVVCKTSEYPTENLETKSVQLDNDGVLSFKMILKM